MPPRQWIDKKNSTKYQLFHRSQYDPLIHDPEADDRVLHHVGGPVPAPASSSSDSSKHARNLTDLEHEFGPDSVRNNEGEAANHGIFFDDTRYDYMQHMRELGTGGGDAHFVEAKSKDKGKGKGMKLEDALRQASLEDTRSDIGGDSVYGPSEYGGDMRSMTSSYSRKPTYQDQQNVPDSIAGFKPDMDPRLREALEALEDEEYVDDDEDIFGELTKSAEEVDPGEWEDTYFDIEDEDDGWESDATEKAPVQRGTTDADAIGNGDGKDANAVSAPGELPSQDEPIPDLQPEDQGWMREFAKFKKEAKSNKTAAPDAPAAPPSVAPSGTLASTVFTAGGTPIRRKKRKGALTNPSAYSMSSSALARTEGHRLLDDRFEKVESLYALDEEDEGDFDDSMSMVSGMTGMTGMTGVSTASSAAPNLIQANGAEVAPRHNFHNIMDDFLSGWDDKTSAQAKRKGAQAKRGKNGNEAIGIKMLDEVRQGLGPARLNKEVPGKA